MQTMKVVIIYLPHSQTIDSIVDSLVWLDQEVLGNGDSNESNEVEVHPDSELHPQGQSLCADGKYGYHK